MPLKAVLSKFLTVGLTLTLSYVDGAVAVAASSSQLPAELSILDVPLKRLCGISPELERSRADQEIAISNARVRSLYLI
ncbi:MAG: hypothetical protein U1E10_12130, partial [Bdellovibrionales bacterium]|nr:hypothetical protein [Bdellovibrionales bacterium]